MHARANKEGGGVREREGSHVIYRSALH
jgi:hypothetical protein